MMSMAIEGVPPEPGLTTSLGKPMLSKPWFHGNPLNQYPWLGLLRTWFKCAVSCGRCHEEHVLYYILLLTGQR